MSSEILFFIVVPITLGILAIITILLFLSRRRTQNLFHRSEQALKIAQDSLNDSAKMRQELKEALERAELTAKNKTNFLATVSHEIRTPLNAIVGYSEFLSDPSLPQSKVKEYAHGISLSSHALLALINDVLDIAKFESGRREGLDLRNGECDIKELFDEMRTVFRMQCNNKGIGLEFAIDADFPKLILTESRFRQIMLNLIGNAVKFTDTGGVTVQASYQENTLTFSVQDTGIGITERGKKIIFEPFSQDTESRRNRFYSGTGLGLSIVKRLVESSNGKITVDSVLGKGSTFTIQIPDVKKLPKQKIAPEQATSESTGKQTAEKHEIKSIVIVDDVAMNRQILQLHCQSLGLNDITTFATGKEVLEYLEGGRLPQLILSDMWMPEMDGAQLAKEVAAKWPQIPVVAVTADNDAGTKFDISAFRSILTKPVTGVKLKNLLETLCLLVLLAGSVLFTGCRSSAPKPEDRYNDFSAWYLRENARPEYFATYDIFYMYPQFFQGNQVSVERINYVTDKISAVFGIKVRIFAPLCYNEKDCSDAFKWYLKFCHSPQRPFVFMAEGDGVDVLKKLVSKAKKEGLVTTRFINGKKRGEFITPEFAEELTEEVRQYLFKRNWGKNQNGK